MRASVFVSTCPILTNGPAEIRYYLRAEKREGRGVSENGLPLDCRYGEEDGSSFARVVRTDLGRERGLL